MGNTGTALGMDAHAPEGEGTAPLPALSYMEAGTVVELTIVDVVPNVTLVEGETPLVVPGDGTAIARGGEGTTKVWAALSVGMLMVGCNTVVEAGTVSNPNAAKDAKRESPGPKGTTPVTIGGGGPAFSLPLFETVVADICTVLNGSPCFPNGTDGGTEAGAGVGASCTEGGVLAATLEGSSVETPPVFPSTGRESEEEGGGKREVGNAAEENVLYVVKEGSERDVPAAERTSYLNSTKPHPKNAHSASEASPPSVKGKMLL